MKYGSDKDTTCVNIRQFFYIWKPEVAFWNPICKPWIPRRMSPNKSVFIVASAIILSLLTACIPVPSLAMASSKGGGSVVQEKVNTGNSNLDKEINKFYSCISKTHQDPPSLEKVDNCYSQTLGGTDIGGSSITTDSSVTGVSATTNSQNQHNKWPI